MLPRYQLQRLELALMGQTQQRWRPGPGFNEAYERMIKGDVRYGFGIDIASPR